MTDKLNEAINGLSLFVNDPEISFVAQMGSQYFKDENNVVKSAIKTLIHHAKKNTEELDILKSQLEKSKNYSASLVSEGISNIEVMSRKLQNAEEKIDVAVGALEKVLIKTGGTLIHPQSYVDAVEAVKYFAENAVKDLKKMEAE